MSLGNDITSIRLDNEIIPRVHHTKFLGIYSDELLEWAYHIDDIRKNIASGLCTINSAKKICPLKT